MTKKAIIEVLSQDDFFRQAREQLASRNERSGDADYYLSFTSARDLHSRLSPARLDLLRTLKTMGTTSNVRALAARAGRNYSNVHADVKALLELGLMEREKDDGVCVPFDGIEIRVLAGEAA